MHLYLVIIALTIYILIINIFICRLKIQIKSLGTTGNCFFFFFLFPNLEIRCVCLIKTLHIYCIYNIIYNEWIFVLILLYIFYVYRQTGCFFKRLICIILNNFNLKYLIINLFSENNI